MTIGIKISKPGFDVNVCDPKDLVFSSEYSSLKVAHQDEPLSGGTYNHGLGYAPMFFATSGNNFLGQNATSPFEIIYYSTSTLFGYPASCKYYLFYQDV